MKRSLIAILLLTSTPVFANGDLFFGDDSQYNIYNDNRRVYQRNTVVKKYYKTIVKEIPVPVPVEVPIPVPTGNMPPMGPNCMMKRAAPILDPYGRVMDYTYVRFCFP